MRRHQRSFERETSMQFPPPPRSNTIRTKTNELDMPVHERCFNTAHFMCVKRYFTRQCPLRDDLKHSTPRD